MNSPYPIHSHTLPLPGPPPTNCFVVSPLKSLKEKCLMVLTKGEQVNKHTGLGYQRQMLAETLGLRKGLRPGLGGCRTSQTNPGH